MEQGWHHRYRRSTVLISGCLGLLVGLGLAAKLPAVAWWLATASGLVAGLYLRQQRLAALIAITCCGLLVGGYRGGQYVEKVDHYQPYYDQKIVATVTAMNDAVYGTTGQLTFDAVGVQIDGQSLVGKLGISGFGENMVYQGDTVVVTGKLRAGRGSYKGWLSYATLHVSAHGGTIIDRWRRQFGAALTSVLPEPLAPFGMGLLIGQRNTLPKATSTMLLWVGLTHIIAVSGYNLTILLKATRKILSHGSKYQTTLLSIGLIGVFLLFAGNSPSIIRAAVVSIIGLLAWYYGRSLHPVLLLLLSACITAYANPSYVWSDSGWYLSFLAFFGVVVVSPLVCQRLPPRLGQSLLGSMVVESICAELMTMPYVLYVFGQTSLVALPANILIASFVPIGMLTTLVAGLAGMWLPSLAGWLAWPANWVLNYMLDACQLLSQIPHVFVDQLYLSLGSMLAWYGAVLIMGWGLLRHQQLRYGTITDRNQLQEARS